MHKLLSLLVLGIIALPVAGCGNSSDTGSGSASSPQKASTGDAATASVGSAAGQPLGRPLSRSQLITKADAICKRLNIELLSAKDTIKTQEDLIRIAPRRAATEQTALDQLSKLSPPASTADDYREMLRTRRIVIQQIKAVGEDAATNKIKAESSIGLASANITHVLQATAHDLGMKDCAHVG